MCAFIIITNNMEKESLMPTPLEGKLSTILNKMQITQLKTTLQRKLFLPFLIFFFLPFLFLKKNFLLVNVLEACGFFVVQSAIFSLFPKAWNSHIDPDGQIFLLTKLLMRQDTEACF